MKIIYLKLSILIILITTLGISYNLTQGSYSKNPSGVSAVSSEGYLFTELVGGLLTVDIRDVSLEEVLQEISTQNGIRFFLPPSLGEEKIMVRFSNCKIDEGLNKILTAYNRIFIYTEEDPNPHQSSLTRLTEVRIYPRSYKGNKKGKWEVTSVKSPKALKPSKESKSKDKAARRFGKEESATSYKSWGKKNPKMSVDKVRKLAERGDAKAIESLASALKDKSPEVRKEAEKALEEIGKELKDESENDSQTDEDVEEPEEGGETNLTLAKGSGNGVNLELSNNIPVRGVQFTLNGTKPTEIHTTSRTEGFFAKVNEKNGMVVLVSISGKKIAPGTGPIAEIICDNTGSAQLSDVKVSE